MQKQINQLARKRLKQGGLDTARTRTSLSGGLYQGEATSSSGTGSGIASPLTEDDNTRTYYSSTELQSSDGLFIMEILNIKSASFSDANGNAVTVNYDDPDS